MRDIICKGLSIYGTIILVIFVGVKRSLLC